MIRCYQNVPVKLAFCIRGSWQNMPEVSRYKLLRMTKCTFFLTFWEMGIRVGRDIFCIFKCTANIEQILWLFGHMVPCFAGQYLIHLSIGIQRFNVTGQKFAVLNPQSADPFAVCGLSTCFYQVLEYLWRKLASNLI